VKIVVMKVEKIQAAGWVPSRTPTAEQRGAKPTGDLRALPGASERAAHEIRRQEAPHRAHPRTILEECRKGGW
jgi:hypothetical protein